MPNQRLAALALIAAATLAAPAVAAAPAPWHHRAAAAFAEARASGKPLLVDAYAAWCGWCRKLERDVFPRPVFADAARGFVLLRIDVEDRGEGTELADAYGAPALPTLLILEPSGALVGAVTGFSPAAELVDRIHARIAEHERALDRYRRTLATGDAEALQRTAIDFWQRRDGARAAALFEKLLGTATLAGRDEAWTRFLLADAWRLAGDVDRARLATAAAEQALQRTADAEPELGERLALLPFWIARTAGDCGRAAGELASFERGHPASRLLSAARRAMDRLRADAGPRCT